MTPIEISHDLPGPPGDATYACGACGKVNVASALGADFALQSVPVYRIKCLWCGWPSDVRAFDLMVAASEAPSARERRPR